MKKTFLIIFLATLTLAPLTSLSAGLVPCGGCAEYNADKTKCITAEPSCQLCHFFVLFKNIVDFLLFKIVPPLAVLMLAIAGFMYIFAYMNPTEAIGGAGGPALISQAKKVITSVIFGLIIIFAAWLLVNVFFTLIGVADWTGLAGGWREGWWQVVCPIR